MTRPSGAAPSDGPGARTVVLVRHGETPLTEVGAFSGGGVAGPSLTTRGRTQAARAADATFRIGKDLWPDLARPAAVVASPAARTLETAVAVGRRTGQPVRTDARFDECDFGEWEGLAADRVAEGWPAELEAWATSGTHRAPGGESLAEVADRAWAGLADVVVGATVVVTHLVAIRSMVGRALDAPPSSWRLLRVPPCSLTVLRLRPGGTGGPGIVAVEVVAVGHPTDR